MISIIVMVIYMILVSIILMYVVRTLLYQSSWLSICVYVDVNVLVKPEQNANANLPI